MARSRGSNIATITDMTWGTISAAGAPCASRSATSVSGVAAAPQTTEASVKPATPMRKIRLRPAMSPSRPPVIRIGLTRGGAITAAIDRLERAGYAGRRRDTSDRRRVLVELVREGPYQDLVEILEGVNRAYAELAAGYSDEELAVVHGFALRANELIDEQTRRLRDQKS